MRALAQNMMAKAVPRIAELKALRGKAYSIMGMYHLLKRFEGASQFRRLLTQLADDLVEMYKENQG